MMDRLDCADGGNPEPTTTTLKDPAKAKALELAGRHYLWHLAGRQFAVVVQGDAVGAETLRRTSRTGCKPGSPISHGSRPQPIARDERTRQSLMTMNPDQNRVIIG